MKAAVFEYVRAKDVADAVKQLAAMPGDAKPIAGGQSLGPMLNLRLARPKLLVDVSKVEALRAIADEGDAWRIGACVTHSQLEDRPLAGCAALAQVARVIAYRAVRNRGTIGGSLAHADPAADWPVVLAALDAVVRITGPAGSRDVKADQLMKSAFATALADDEIIESIRVPKLSKSAAWGYYKFCRKTGEFAQASCAAVFDPVHGTARIVLGALDGAPAPLPQLAGALARQGAAALAGDAVRDAVCQAAGTEDPVRLQLMVAAVQRCLKQVMEG